MKSTTLVIMAAGMGSRFGGGIKQLEAMGPTAKLSWTIPFMMLLKQDLIK